jgi:hypothetical protein
MIDTYGEYSPLNPINQEENEKEIVIEPASLFEAVNECDDKMTDYYFDHISKRLQHLIDYYSTTDNLYTESALINIKNLLR